MPSSSSCAPGVALGGSSTKLAGRLLFSQSWVRFSRECDFPRMLCCQSTQHQGGAKLNRSRRLQRGGLTQCSEAEGASVSSWLGGVLGRDNWAPSQVSGTPGAPSLRGLTGTHAHVNLYELLKLSWKLVGCCKASSWS